MKIAGFDFTKIMAEKFPSEKGKIKISTNIDISEIDKLKSDFMSGKEELIKIKFKYDINYEPSLAKLNFEGNLILAVEPKIAKDVLKQWKSKKIPPEFRIVVFNIILRKSSIKALQLEEEMNLPAHMPFPSLRPGEEN